MTFRGFKASREDRRLLGSFRNFSGRTKWRLASIAREFDVEVTPNEHSRVPTIEQLYGSSAYDVSLYGKHLVTVSVIIDEFCKSLSLQATGPLYGDSHAFCTASDTTFELMMTNLAFLLRRHLAEAA